MFTEKTLGKLELLQDYLSEKYSSDDVAKTILSAIVADLKTPTEKQKVSTTELRLVQQKHGVKSSHKHTPKKYPETIDLSKVSKGNFQNLVNKRVENKKWENSTVMNRATYDKSSKTLTVYEKRNIIHEYHNVPNNVKEALFKNGKPGKFYHTYIQGKYKSKDLSLVG